MTFILALPVDLQGISCLATWGVLSHKVFLPVALLYSKGKLFSPPECFQGMVQCLMCWGGDDVWVKQGHFVQYFGSSRIRSIMPSMALHNVKVPVASETSPHHCQAALLLSVVFVHCLAFMAPGEIYICWLEIPQGNFVLSWGSRGCFPYHGHSLIPECHGPGTGFSAKNLFPFVKVLKVQHERHSLF